MPRVPGYKLGEVEASSSGPQYQSIRGVSAAAFGGGVAEGLSQLGGSLERGVDTTAGTLLLQKSEDYEKEAKALDNELAEGYRSLLLTGETPYYSLKGQAAVDARKSTEEALTKLNTDVLNKASNPKVKEMLNSQANQRFGSAAEGMAKYSMAANEEAKNTVSEVRQTEAIDDAAAGWSSDSAIARSSAIMDAEIMDQAKRNGWSPEVAVSKSQSARTLVYEAAIRSAIASGDPGRGRQVFDRMKGNLDAKQRIQLEASLQDANLATDAYAKLDQIRSSTKSMSGQLAEAGKIHDGKLRETVEGLLRQSQSDTVRIYNAGRTLGAEGRLVASQKAADEVLDKTTDFSSAMDYAKSNFTGEQRENVQNLIQAHYSDEVRAIAVEKSLSAAEDAQRIQNAGDVIDQLGGTEAEKLERARSIPDPEIRKGVLQDIKVRLAEQKKNVSLEILQSISAATQYVDEGGDLREWQKRNPDAYGKLATRPSTLAALQKKQLAIAEGKMYADITDPKLYSELMSQPPAELAKLDPNTYRESLEQKDFNKLVTAVKTAKSQMSRTDGPKSDMKYYNEADSLIKQYASTDFMFGERDISQAIKDKQVELTNSIHADITSLLQTNPTPKQDDLEKVVKDNLKTVTTEDGEDHWYWNRSTTYAGLVKDLPTEQKKLIRVPIREIKPDDVEVARAAFRASEIGGRKKQVIEPTDEMIEQYYGARVLGDRPRMMQLLGIVSDPIPQKVPGKQANNEKE